MNVKCYLDSIRKYRNKQEYRTVDRITCPEFKLEISGDGEIVKQMASLLHENKCDINRGYEVLRDGTLCFVLHPLKSWVEKEDRRPEWLKQR